MATKIENLLTDGERIILDARVHRIVFIPPAFLLFIALCAAVFFHPIMGAVFLFLTLYPIYNAYVHYKMTHLVLTNKKVLSRAGFLSRDWTRMAFDKIENAYLEEPIIGRQLGYSTVVVSGVGSGSIRVPYIHNGAEFVKILEKELEAHQSRQK